MVCSVIILLCKFSNSKFDFFFFLKAVAFSGKEWCSRDILQETTQSNPIVQIEVAVKDMPRQFFYSNGKKN